MTARRQVSSFWPVIETSFERSPLGMKPPGSPAPFHAAARYWLLQICVRLVLRKSPLFPDTNSPLRT